MKLRNALRHRLRHLAMCERTVTIDGSEASEEAFHVLAGQLSQKTPQGLNKVEVSETMPARGPDTPMEVSSTGTTDMHALVMFVVDAARPFSTSAHLE
jgi:hypothetical protein